MITVLAGCRSRPCRDGNCLARFDVPDLKRPCAVVNAESKESAVGAQKQILDRPARRGKAPGFLIVGQIPDADAALVVRPGVAAIPAIEDQIDCALWPDTVRLAEAQVGERQAGNDFVAQLRIGTEALGFRQGVQAIKPLADLPAEPARPRLVEVRLLGWEG
jgi:hypothetical protein